MDPNEDGQMSHLPDLDTAAFPSSSYACDGGENVAQEADEVKKDAYILAK